MELLVGAMLPANDPQYGFTSKGPGTAQDRNVETSNFRFKPSVAPSRKLSSIV